MTATNGEHFDEAALLAELLEISNRSGISRFDLVNKSFNTIPESVEFEIGDVHDDKENSRNVSGIHDQKNTECNAQSFLNQTPEISSLNQYWYSETTIKTICDAILEVADGKRIAFLSTPSLYFALPITTRDRCTLFDFDDQWSNDPGFEFYDFRQCEDINPTLHHTFDMVVSDPPFISEEVWLKYGRTTKLLLKKSEAAEEGKDHDNRMNGLVLGTTVAENCSFMEEIFQARPAAFKPKVTNLVYQYKVYTNFDSKCLSELNPEIGS